MRIAAYGSLKYYGSDLERSRRRMADFEERGADALSKYDKEIAFGGDVERSLVVSKMLVTNYIAYF